MKRLIALLLAVSFTSWSDYVTLPGGAYVPYYSFFAGGQPTFNSVALTAETHKYGYVLRVPATGTLEGVRIRFSAVTKGGDTDLKVSFQDVDLTNGNPDGTADQYDILATASIVADSMSPLMTLTVDDAGVTKRSVTQGDLTAVVVAYNTFNAGDSIAISNLGEGTRAGAFTAQNYEIVDITGSWVKTSTRSPVIVLEYEGGAIYPISGVFPFSALGSLSYASNSDPDEYGVRFQLPFKAKIGGMWVSGDLDGDFNVVLYSSSGSTTLISADKDVRSHNVAALSFLTFSTDVEVLADTFYVLSIQPTTTTSVGIYYADVPAAGALNQYWSQNSTHVSAKDPTTTSDFSSTSTRIFHIGLWITQVDVTPGSGDGEHSHIFVQ